MQIWNLSKDMWREGHLEGEMSPNIDNNLILALLCSNLVIHGGRSMSISFTAISQHLTHCRNH